MGGSFSQVSPAETTETMYYRQAGQEASNDKRPGMGSKLNFVSTNNIGDHAFKNGLFAASSSSNQ